MNAKLVIVRGQPHGKSLVFPQGEFVIGRGTECHIRPNSSWVSRQHFLLCVAKDRVWLRDLGSTNGTLINGRRVLGEKPLTHGDKIQVGPLVFEIELDASGVIDTSSHCILETAESRPLIDGNTILSQTAHLFES